jgi:hypothetical protein
VVESSRLPTVGYANDVAETEPLLGMALLRGYRLQVDTIEDGLVMDRNVIESQLKRTERKPSLEWV